MVCEYEDVFPDELLGLPPHRDVDFIIESHPGTSLISMTPHRMALVELQELKVQLQESLPHISFYAAVIEQRLVNLCNRSLIAAVLQRFKTVARKIKNLHVSFLMQRF